MGLLNVKHVVDIDSYCDFSRLVFILSIAKVGAVKLLVVALDLGVVHQHRVQTLQITQEVVQTFNFDALNHVKLLSLLFNPLALRQIPPQVLNRVKQLYFLIFCFNLVACCLKSHFFEDCDKLRLSDEVEGNRVVLVDFGADDQDVSDDILEI